MIVYTKRGNLILGFHGCDAYVRDEVVLKKGVLLKESANNYDWLGNGIYFWENNYQRALQFAQELKDNPRKGKQMINEPAVIGAIIDLGYCLDFMDSAYLPYLKESYETLKKIHEVQGLAIPENKKTGSNPDLLLRYLDCAVIETLHLYFKEETNTSFDSVRGMFLEGDDLYPNAGFKEKNHVQIAIRNPNCIKGFFIPRELDPKFTNP